MRIAVTGGKGFVGRHVVAELLRRDLAMVATERAQSASRRPTSDPRVTWVDMDIAAQPEGAFDALGRPDLLIHLAWDGLPNYRSLHHFEQELPRHYAFLSSMVRAGLPAMVTVGTCFEYGMQSGALEASAETRPDNPYGYAKDALRKQLQFLQGIVPFAMTWGRLFYMHGDGQATGSLYPTLRRAAETGQPTLAMSGGEQLRDYLPVTEVAKQIVDLSQEPRNRGAVNICSGVPTSVRRLAEGWVAKEGWPIELQFGALPYPTYEPMAFWGVPFQDGTNTPQFGS